MIILSGMRHVILGISYRFFTSFRMTTMRKRVILNEVKDLYAA